MRITDAIIHWVPLADSSSEIQLSEDVAILADRDFWTQKIEDSIAHRYTRDIEDIPETPSNVVHRARLSVSCNKTQFIDYSKQIAEILYDVQTRQNISEGFLVVFRGTGTGRRFVCILKLEGIRGSAADFDRRRRAFEMRALEKILLTQKTRVFKMAIFEFDGGNLVRALAMDDQVNREEISHFWLVRFLGCRFPRTPEELTRAFFSIVSDFASSIRLTSQEAVNVRTALFVEMNSNKKTLSLARFANDHVPSMALPDFNRRTEGSGLPMHDFEKVVGPKLRRAIALRRFVLEENITAIVPQSVLDAGTLAKLVDVRGQTRLEIRAKVLRENK